MSATELRLSFRLDETWLGELDAVVKSGAFSGQGSAWFKPVSLKETFVAALRAYPLTSTAPPMMEGGFGSMKNPGSLDQCHLRIVVTPYDSSGTLLARIDLATQSWKTPDIDQQQSVTVRFLTEYAAVGEFADALDRVLDGSNEQAILKGART
jgi:hypothetical protein